MFFVSVLTDPALVLFFSSLSCRRADSRRCVLSVEPAPAGIEKPPTQWTVQRRAGMWRA
jgi:hypothetical protein